MLTWPAPERNKEPILAVLRRVLPAQGLVLEVASGTGQHVIHFAAALPRLYWQPSDPESGHREAIQSRIIAAGAANVSAPLELDASKRPWPVRAADAVVCINMIHVAPWAAALALLAEAGRLLPPGGVLYLYGPYRRGGRHTAPSNEEFDADLRRRDPQWGVRDLDDVVLQARAQSLRLHDVVAMPANNFSVVFRRDSGPPA